MSGEDLVNDIKIGNYVELFGKTVQVRSSDFVTPTFKGAGHAIALDHDWFIWAGFTQKDLSLSKSSYYEKGPISFNITFGDWYVGGQRINPVNREYVHQLQNLFYEVTRTPLTFNFPEWMQTKLG